jgi:hypothetical protein
MSIFVWKSFIRACIHSFSAYYVPGTVPDIDNLQKEKVSLTLGELAVY